MVWLSESNRSQILQLLFSCSLLVYFLFWYSRIGTLCGQPSILVRQREGVVNFRVKMYAQKSSKLKKSDFLTYNHPWRSQPHRDRDLGHESSLMFLRHWQDNSKFDLMDARQPATGSYRSTSGPTSVLPVRLNQSSFFAFFESSIMRKIEPGSRLGSRACCVSGRALSEGGFALNTRLVYFVSEQVFPSGAWFKSALPLSISMVCICSTDQHAVVAFGVHKHNERDNFMRS